MSRRKPTSAHWHYHWNDIRAQALNGTLEVPRFVRRAAEQIIAQWKVEAEASAEFWGKCAKQGKKR